MRAVWQIFRADCRRITASVVAVVVLMGLCLVPCLYAWFNIFSNWDPYGPDATDGIQVAVSNQDVGAELLGIRLNVGELVLEGLQSNRQLGWVFVDSGEEAIAGVESGTYYAALVLPESFSADFLSVLEGELQHPQIHYYENQKKNAIAPKITNKAKSAVQEQINATLVSKTADILGKVSTVMDALHLNSADVAEQLAQRLESAATAAEGLSGAMDSLRSTVTAANSLMDCTDVVLNDAGQAVHDAANREIDPALADVLTAMDEIDGQVQIISDRLTAALSDADRCKAFLDDGAQAICGQLDELSQRLRTLAQRPLVPSTLANRLNAAAERLEAVSRQLTAATDDTDSLLAALSQAREELRLGAAAINGQLEATLNTLTQETQQAAAAVQGLMSGSESAVASLRELLGSYDAALSDADDTLGSAMALADTAGGALREMAAQVRQLGQSPQLQKLTQLAEVSPEELAESLARPVQLDTVELYAIDNYGSAMAPYYIMLALFVGSLLAATMVQVPIRTLPEGVGILRPWQRFWGRYLLFLAIGMAQALITALGCLYYVEIQCVHPVLLVLVCCVCSLNFSLMNYALVYALDNAGMALSVVIMVLQVAGSGGVYPVEVLPAVFQKLYVAMPFRYGMDALRETIAGSYGSLYWRNIAVLMGMCLLFVALGMLLKRPAQRFNDAIARSKHESGLM